MDDDGTAPATLALGTRYEMVPAPPVEADTQYVDAGAVRIGVEYRVLTDDNLLDAYADDPRGAAIVQAAKLPVVDESGVSLHVMDAANGNEVLRFDPERGGFRVFLKMLLRGFVGNSDKARRRLKRGGGVRVFAFEDAPVPPDEVAAAPGGDPEKAFDRAWVTELVDRALERVKERCALSGRPWMFRVYEDYDLAPKESRPTAAELEQRLGLPAGSAAPALQSVRRQLRDEIRLELSRLAAEGGGVDDEWNALFEPGGAGPAGP